jgi:hypothetical protein
MIYKNAARKTASFMSLALVLSFGIMMIISGQSGVTGRVTSAGAKPAPEVLSWSMLVLGVFIAMSFVGMYVYISRVEAKK